MLTHKTEEAVLSGPAEVAILSLLKGVWQAHHDKRGAAIADRYESNATVFNLAPPLKHSGVDAAEKQAWLDSWEGPVRIEPRDMQIHVEGNQAFVHGFLRMSGTKKGPEGTVSFWMRETVCLKRRAGEWRIVHEHTSNPFYMDGTLRPAFDLEP